VSAMSEKTPLDRSGRAPLVQPGPSAPAVPTGSSTKPANARFEFLPDAPMKRPPPDPEARLFVASQHTDAVLAAQAQALRHRMPSTLKRVTVDVREDAHVGKALVSEARGKIVQLSALGSRVAASCTRAVWAFVVGHASAAVARSRAGVLHGQRALRRHLTLLGAGAMYLLQGAASLMGRAMGRAAHAGAVGASLTGRGVRGAVAALSVSSLAVWRSLRVGILLVLYGGSVLTGRAVRRAAEALAVSALFTWRWTRKVLLGASLTLLAVGLALAAIIVGLAGAARSGVVFLLKVIRAQSPARSTATQLEPVVAVRASPHVPSFAARLTGDIARVRVTVRWHARSARPIIGAVTAAFASQIGRTFRLAPPTRAAIAVAVGLIGVAAYGSLNRQNRATLSTPPAAATMASGPTLASVVPAPSAADTIEALRTIKGRSIELLTPAPPAPVVASLSPVTAPASTEESARKRDVMLGSLFIASAPKGASVTVDGIPQGRAPVAIRRLRAGNRLVRVELDGYHRWSWAVYVTPSKQTKVNVSLVPETGTSSSSAVTNTASFAK
jgi:hypothetical protein